MDMRRVWVLAVGVLVSFAIGRAEAQTSAVSVQAAAGPTLIDAGHNLSAALGFSPASRITLLGGVEQAHLASRTTYGEAPGGRRVVTSQFRGGTITAASAGLRVSLFPADRITPYVIAGFGIGVSRPTVNEAFPTRVSNDARFLIAGGGMDVPLRGRLSLFGDVRTFFGAEGVEGILAVVPIRAGMRWRF
jgi:hypothetical protein